MPKKKLEPTKHKLGKFFINQPKHKHTPFQSIKNPAFVKYFLWYFLTMLDMFERISKQIILVILLLILNFH